MNFTYEKLADGLVYYKNAIKDPYKIIDQIEFLDKKIVEDQNNKIVRSFQTN